MSSGSPDSPAQRFLRAFRWDALSDDESRLLRAIRSHQGHDQAVPVDVAAQRAGLHPRRAQDVVKDLIEKHGVPIGSSSSASKPGWYLCVDEEERRHNRDALRGRALSILRRAKAFEPGSNTRLAELFGAQEPLPFGGAR